MRKCPECGLPLRGRAAQELWQVDRMLAGLRDQEARLLTRREELLGVLREWRARGEEGPAGAEPEQVGRAVTAAVGADAATGTERDAPTGSAREGTATVGVGAAIGPVRDGVTGPGGDGASGAAWGAATRAGWAGAGRGGAGRGGAGPGGAAGPGWRGSAPGPGGGVGSGGQEVGAGAVRNLLLILGGLLLTVAAIVFTVVSWGQMGVGGRAAVLAAFTALAMLAPVVLLRRGLRATAETIAGLAVVLLLLDGYAARAVGLFGLDAVDALDYTAGVCGLAALILAAYAWTVPLRGPAPVAVVLAQPVLPLTLADTRFTVVAAMMVATVALDVALVRYLVRYGDAVRWAGARRAAVVCASVVAVLVLSAGSANAFAGTGVGEAVARSLPLVALAALAGYVTRELARTRGRSVGVVAATVLGALSLIIAMAAPVQVATASLDVGWQPLTYLIPAVLVTVAATGIPWAASRAAGMATGAAVAALAALVAMSRVVTTLAAPLTWLDAFSTDVWERAPHPDAGAGPGDVVVLGVLAAGLLVPPARRVEGRAGGRIAPVTTPLALGFAALLVAVAPAAFAMPYPAIVSVQVALAAVAAAGAVRTSDPGWAAIYAVIAGGAALEAAGYAAGSRTATLIVLPILAVLAAVVTLRARGAVLRMCGLAAAVCFAGLEATAAGLAVGLTVPVAASVGFAVAGGLLLIASPRAGRIRGAVLRYTGTALLLWASWLRLWAADVDVVEAYTVPLSLVLLGFGWWWRRSANLSSWAAYGPGLSSTMVPSLVVVYSDPDWRRSLALGAAALAVLLAGARFRLQAPVLIGGVVLAGVAVRELAPQVSELLLAVPRWVPMAVGGLLLVVVGATYEARKRDLRVLRDRLAKMG